MTIRYSTVGIVGTGAMGRGIAQIAAQAGSTVQLFDLNPEACRQAHAAITAQWDKLQDKGRIDAATAEVDARHFLTSLIQQRLAERVDAS